MGVQNAFANRFGGHYTHTTENPYKYETYPNFQRELKSHYARTMKREFPPRAPNFGQAPQINVSGRVYSDRIAR